MASCEVSLTIPVSEDTGSKFLNQKPFHFYGLTANKDFTAFIAVKDSNLVYLTHDIGLCQ